MKETVLLYNFNDKDRLMKIRQALLPLGFRVKTCLLYTSRCV